MSTAQAGLVVTISGNATQLQNSVNNAQNALNSLGQAGANAGNALNNSLHGMSGAAFQARYAVIDLSHVVRDLPYALANPAILTGPFDRMFQAVVSLNQQTGSFGGTLSLLRQQLTGGAGLMIAFNLLSTAASIFAGQMSNAGDKAEEAKAKIKTYKDFADGAAGDVSKEATNVESLIAVLRSETAERNKKLAAIKELKSINPEIFGQLKLEGETVTGLSAAYKEYVANLNTVMAAKMVQARLEDVTNKILKAEGADLTKSEREGVEWLKKFNQEQRNKEEGAHRATAADKLQSESLKNLNDLYKQQRELRDQLSGFEKGIKVKEPQATGTGEKESFNFFDRYFSFDPNAVNLSAKKTAELYTTALEYALKNQGTFKGLEAIVNAPNQGAALTVAKKWWADVQNGIVQLQPPSLDEQVYIVPRLETNDAQVISYVHALQQQLTSTQGVNPFDFSKVDKDLLVWKYSQMFKDIGEKMPTDITYKNGLGEDLKSSVADMGDLVILAKALGDAFDKAKTPLEDLNKTLKQTAQSGFANAFSSLGKGIGDAIAGDGGFQDAFKGIFAGLGDMIEQLGEAIIQYGVAKEIALTAIKSLQPGAAIAAGVGLVILGEVIKTKMTSPKGFSQGGLVPGSGNSDTVPAMLTPGEYVLTRDTVNRLSGGNVANIQSLINGLALKSSSFDVRGISSGIGRSPGLIASGNTSIEVYGRMSGKDIVLSGARTGRSQRRAF
jgi:hypothetical protein